MSVTLYDAKVQIYPHISDFSEVILNAYMITFCSRKLQKNSQDMESPLHILPASEVTDFVPSRGTNILTFIKQEMSNNSRITKKIFVPTSAVVGSHWILYVRIGNPRESTSVRASVFIATEYEWILMIPRVASRRISSL